MKKLYIIIFSLVMVIILCTVSGEANIEYFFASMLYGNFSGGSNDIIFSKKSGFYEDEFELFLYAPTNEIYYTLDGSEPDKDSIKYEKPIAIKDATNNSNVYSMMEDVTTEFLDEELEKYSKEERRVYYTTPDYNIDKCTVIKVVYYDRYGQKSAVEERNYFVDFDEKTGYENVNVISISTDPANLFDYEKGIYVTGKTYDEFCQEIVMEDYWAKEYWSQWGANYHNKGREWERESCVHIYNKNKEMVLSQDVGIRIQGGGSRGFLPKSLNIYAREEYGEKQLNYDFFGTGYYPKRVTLSNGGDDYYTKIKDRLVSELADQCNIVTMNYEPYVLFLNGEYWGFYYLTEKYDVQYIEHYYGVDKGTLIDDIIMIKNGLVEAGVEADWYVSYSEMQEFIMNNDMSIMENYNKACELIDISSFIDYFAVEGYVSRSGDWPDSNFALWRSRYVSENAYGDGKWRWMLFDVNSTSMSRGLTEQDIISHLKNSSDLFAGLYNNEQFQRMFCERLIELSDTIFEKEAVNQKIDEYVRLMDEPMEKHYQRFFGTSNDKFYEEIEIIREFFDERRTYVDESIKRHFGEEYLGETTR